MGCTSGSDSHRNLGTFDGTHTEQVVVGIIDEP
jgi:hypothetical protein